MEWITLLQESDTPLPYSTTCIACGQVLSYTGHQGTYIGICPNCGHFIHINIGDPNVC